MAGRIRIVLHVRPEPGDTEQRTLDLVADALARQKINAILYVEGGNAIDLVLGEVWPASRWARFGAWMRRLYR